MTVTNFKFQPRTYEFLAPRILLLTVIFLASVLWTKAADADDAITLNFVTNGSYTIGVKEAKALAYKLGLFNAKYEAVKQAADIFAKRNLIQFENGDKKELVALVAQALSYEMLGDEWMDTNGKTIYNVKLHTLVQLSDFIDAQLEILKMGRKMASEAYRDEMEPPHPEFLEPGRALAKAYWLIRKNELRMAIIYLDGLTRQYPNWQEPFQTRTMAVQLQHK